MRATCRRFTLSQILEVAPAGICREWPRAGFESDPFHHLNGVVADVWLQVPKRSDIPFKCSPGCRERAQISGGRI